MKKNKRAAYRPLAFEQLEARLPFAGNVTIAVKGGSLTITGDAVENQINVHQTDTGSFQVSGLDGENFRQKGQADTKAFVNVTGVTKNIKVDLKGGGDDFVELKGLYQTNPENPERVLANNVTVRGASVDFETAKITGKLNINTGHHVTSPSVFIGDNYLSNTVKISETNVSPFHGHVFFSNNIVRGNVTINARSAIGSWSDIDLITNVFLGKVVSITTGNGNDIVNVADATVSRLVVKLKAGNDLLTMGLAPPVPNQFAVDSAIIDLGKGDDLFNILAPVFLRGPGKTKVLGGAGDDSINGTGKLTIGSEFFLADPDLGKSGFEHIS